MGYYSDVYAESKPGYKRVGTYFGIKNAEDAANSWNRLGDVIITHTEHKHNADFYSVWLKKKTLLEKLLEINLWD